MKRISCLTLLLSLAMACLAADDDGFVPLFDGKSLSGWVRLDGKPITNWTARDGMLCRTSTGGDIYTAKEYANFVLEFEWKLPAKGNSGVKYRMSRFKNQYRGPEYQCYDDPKNGNGRFLTASIYELFAPNEKKKLNPPEQWNSARIVANGTKIEHWINGEKVVEADTASEAWSKAVLASKFKDEPDFGRSPKGRIMLQDHGANVCFRNVRIKELP